MNDGKHHASIERELPFSTAMESQSGQVRARKHVATNNFAGRIGGNQRLLPPDDSVTTQPDAQALRSFKSALALGSFKSLQLWRMALLEGFGSCLLNFVLGSLASGLQISAFSHPVQVVLGSTISWFSLSLFTFCLGPISGGHLTPVITLTTLCIGLTTIPRAVLYISSQVAGAVVAGYWLKGAVGKSYFESGVIPGCTVVAGQVSPGQLFVLEFGFCLVLIFLACGLGLDPRQHNTIPPAFGPVLVGLAFGVVNAASGVAAPGYTGMSFNPARCLGLMAPLGNFQYHYIHWLAPFTAAGVNGAMYRIVPPWTK